MNNPCCPPFDPRPWDDQVLAWQNRPFVRDRVTSLFHIPLNFGAVIRRNASAIAAAGAMPESMLVLSDENSLWGADVYIAVNRDVPQAAMTTLSGTFRSKVFEGSFRNTRHWIREMRASVTAHGQRVHRLFFYYTTCPKCAKASGKNYVVILAQIQEPSARP